MNKLLDFLYTCVMFFIPRYITLESLVILKEGSVAEVEEAFPVEFISEDEWSEIKNDPPDGVAYVQYFVWTFFNKPHGVISTPLISFEKWMKPMNEKTLEDFLDKYKDELFKICKECGDQLEDIDELSLSGVVLQYTDKDGYTYSMTINVENLENEND